MMRTVAIAVLGAFAAMSARAADFEIVTTPIGARDTADMMSGKCPWSVALKGVEGDFECSVEDMEGDLVAGPFVTSPFPVPHPLAWTAETPNCYRLVVRRGEVTEEKVFGFHVREIVDRRLLVNGRAVRVKFAPKELNGNAEFASRIAQEDALARGVYSLTGREAAFVEHEVGSDNFGATRHALQDWSVEATNYFERIVVRNSNAFVDSTGVELKWTLFKDGKRIDSGELDLRALGPGEDAEYDMPKEAVEARFKEGTVSIRFEFTRDGEVIASDQIDLVESRETSPLCEPGGWFSPSKTAFERRDDKLVFTTGGMLSHGIEFSFGEDGTLPVRFARRGTFGDKVLVKDGAIAVNLDPCRASRKPTSSVGERGGALSFATRTELRHGPEYGRYMTIDATWTVFPNGVVACRSLFTGANDVGRVGYTFDIPCKMPSSWYRLDWSMPMPGENLDVEWFGLGPWPTTPSDTEGAFLGRWKATAEQRLSAEKVRGVRVGDLTVRTLGAPFAFSLSEASGSLNDGYMTYRLAIYGEPDADGMAELAFTLTADDDELTALSPSFNGN